MIPQWQTRCAGCANTVRVIGNTVFVGRGLLPAIRSSLGVGLRSRSVEGGYSRTGPKRADRTVSHDRN